MKKKIIGLLLLANSIFGAEIKLNSASMETSLNVLDSIKGPMSSTYSKKYWDTSMQINLKSEIDFHSRGKVILDGKMSNVPKNRKVDLIYKNANEDFELSLGGSVIKTLWYDLDKNGYGEGNTGYDEDEWFTQLSLSMNFDENTYLKWKVTEDDKISMTYYPWYIPITWEDWDTWESFTEYKQNPGIEFKYRNDKNSSLSLKLAILNTKDYTVQNEIAALTNLKTKISNTNISTYLGISTESKDKKQIAYGGILDVNLSPKVGVKLTANSTKYGENETKLGVFTKINYKVGNIGSYNSNIYVSTLWKNEEALDESDKGDTDIKLNTDSTDDGTNWIDSTGAGNLVKLETGLVLENKGFKITPKMSYTTREKDAYAKYNDGENLSKNRTTMGVNIKYEL